MKNIEIVVGIGVAFGASITMFAPRSAIAEFQYIQSGPTAPVQTPASRPPVYTAPAVSAAPSSSPALSVRPIAPPPPPPPTAPVGPPVSLSPAVNPAPVVGPQSSAHTGSSGTIAVAERSASSIEGIVNGSGSDLPLTLVLKRIVPPEVRFSSLPSVVSTKRVSFRGDGRPWRVVLDETLSGAGLVGRFQGSVLTIELIGSPSSAASSAALRAPVAPLTAVPGAPLVTAPAAPPSSTPITLASSSAPVTAQRAAPVQSAVPSAQTARRDLTPKASAASPLRLDDDNGDGKHVPPIAALIRNANGAMDAPPLGAPDFAANYSSAVTPRTWRVMAGSTVESTIASWSHELGFQPPDNKTGLSWQIEFNASYTGTYLEALEWLCHGFDSADKRPDWRFSRTNLVTVILVKS